MGYTTTVEFDQIRLSPVPELALRDSSNVGLQTGRGKSNVINRLGNATFRKQALGVSLISHRCLKLSIRCTPVTHDWGNRGGLRRSAQAIQACGCFSAPVDQIIRKYLGQKAITCVTVGPEEMISKIVSSSLLLTASI
ncbi:hypothetical protein BGZ61DRAFT_472938 [Ilyonectria robusta]|uniref:uncharacterized protein n=1 Tax=Ilyonectria robusta TaxID=1079257 RepID=UPI001E8E1973|nr:uncharacterized protein BGZ61DRAFT_472938 [Ilyonectria robusta]KAH8736624.1 hypothetical protein BGZ61DRAFT_472938 [Ilyonectria robusta]